MSHPVKYMTVTIVVLLFSLLQATAVWARSDESIQRDIEAQLAESKKWGEHPSWSMWTTGLWCWAQ